MWRRFIIVNPDGPRVQGDIPARSDEEAVRKMETLLTQPTSNDVWLVFEAPAGFPSSLQPYAGDDPTVLAILAEAYHSEISNGLLPIQADLFGPSMTP